MSDRSDSSGATIAVVAVLMLILLLATGGIGAFFLVVRQQRAAVVAMEMRELAEARQAEMVAKLRAAGVKQQEESAQSLSSQSSSNQSAAAVDATAAAGAESAPAAIEAVLRAQADAWNAGKIDEFMQHYWNSDELTFSSGGKITRGWTATSNRYHEKYPTPEKMGKLTFDELEIKVLGGSAALVLGRWNLQRETEPLTGNFSLVVQMINGQWVIIHDHTSRLSE